MEWTFQGRAFQLKVKLWFKRHSLRLLTNSSHASCCHGIFQLPYIPGVALSAPAQRDVWGGKVHETSQQRERIGSQGDFRAAPSKKIQTISYFACLFALASTLVFGSTHHCNICFLSPVSHPHPPLLSPHPRAADPSSCVAETCGKVAAAERRLLVNRAVALQACELMLAEFAECACSPEWEERLIEVKGFICLLLPLGVAC